MQFSALDKIQIATLEHWFYEDEFIVHPTGDVIFRGPNGLYYLHVDFSNVVSHHPSLSEAILKWEDS